MTTYVEQTLIDAVGRPTYRFGDPDTSRQAAREAPSRELQRERVLAALRDAGQRGLTDYETSLITGIPRHIAARRRKDLQQMGEVVATDCRRKTDTGCTAVVWCVRVIDVDTKGRT